MYNTRHVRFLVDGCRTYAALNGAKGEQLSKMAYLCGADVLFNIQKWTFEEFKIPFLSMALTTRRNQLTRPKTMQIIVDSSIGYLTKWLNFYEKFDVRVKFIGDVELFAKSGENPKEVLRGLKDIEQATKDNSTFHFFPMVSYDSVHEYMALLAKNQTQDVKKLIHTYYGSDVPEVDFITRFWRPRLSSCIPILVGEYADVYMEPIPFHFFTKDRYETILKDYSMRVSSKGGGFVHTEDDLNHLYNLDVDFAAVRPQIIGSKIGNLWIPVEKNEK